MRVEQEPIPSAEEMFQEESYYAVASGEEYEVCKFANDYLKRHKERIRYEYDQYQFFLEGYKNGSASISEVKEAHDRFIKLLET